MAFQLKRHASIASEVKRVVLHQLELAISELQSIGDPKSDEAIHEARRRVKKIRAVIRLVRPFLDKAHRAVDHDLRDVSRLLAPVADGQGIIETLDGIARPYRKILPKHAIVSIRSGLIERGARTDRDAGARGVLGMAAGTLRNDRKRIQLWTIHADGFPVIEHGLEASYRRARRAMILAWSHPKTTHFHSWRRFVKDHWFHVRLLEGPCRNRLVRYERRLEALDGVLGEYHNVILLREVIAGDAYAPQDETARCLRVFGRYQRVLRHHAEALGVRIYSDKPGRFVRTVQRFWDNPLPAQKDAKHADRRGR